MRLWRVTSATSAAVAARAVHAAVEGAAFPLTPKGFACLVLVHNAAVAYYVGPGKALGLVLQATVVCTVGRFAVVLLTTLPKMRGAEQECMQSIYQWNPPGELGESGAWQVVKTLASIFSKTDDSMPGISDLDPIPFHELFVRLCYKFDDTENDPEIDSNPEGGTKEGIDDAFIDTLALYLHFSDVIYEAKSEEMLLAVLKEKGYALNFAKMSAEWGTEHTPAYFVATNNDKKELLVCIRGTREVQDVLADITAFPVEFDGTGHQVHSGMLASALWLCKRIISLAKVAQRAGYRLTLTGHSLGAATAVMLAMLLKRRGVDNLYVYGIATPACMAKELALGCRDYVQSVAFRDDVVVRVSPQSLVKLYGELITYDWESAFQERGKDNAMLRISAKLAQTVRAVSSPWEPPDRSNAPAQTQEDSKDYSPYVPGKILFMHRARKVLDATDAPELQAAMVDGTCPQLRCLHVTRFMVMDHLTTSYFTALSRPNPLEEWLERKQREKEEEEKGEGKSKKSESESEEQHAKAVAEDTGNFDGEDEERGDDLV